VKQRIAGSARAVVRKLNTCCDCCVTHLVLSNVHVAFHICIIITKVGKVRCAPAAATQHKVCSAVCCEQRSEVRIPVAGSDPQNTLYALLMQS
jgi:hypothetical protein